MNSDELFAYHRAVWLAEVQRLLTQRMFEDGVEPVTQKERDTQIRAARLANQSMGRLDGGHWLDRDEADENDAKPLYPQVLINPRIKREPTEPLVKPDVAEWLKQWFEKEVENAPEDGR